MNVIEFPHEIKLMTIKETRKNLKVFFNSSNFKTHKKERYN